jgi:hypothetical protein
MKYVLLIAVTLLAVSCKHSTGPEWKHPRDYQWSVDTIPHSMFSMWGSSNEDVYLGGANVIYHYDGQQWQIVPLTANEAGPISRLGYFNSIYGFGPKDVFAVAGWFSLVLHFDGSRWVQQQVPVGQELLTVWGCSAQDVWAGGASGTLLHYDGIRWSRIAMDPRLQINSINGFESSNVFLLGTRINDPANYYLNYKILYHYDGASWQVVDSMSMSGSQLGTSFGEAKLATIGGTLYSFGYGIYSLRSGAWRRDLNTEYCIQSISVPSSTNAYAVAQGGYVYHFDGNNWTQLNIPQSGRCDFVAVWSSDTETFMAAMTSDPSLTIVLHGR